MFSIVFLLCAFTSALFLVLLFYGAERQTHRLATAALFLAIIISVLVAATVLEGSRINDQVPTIRAPTQARDAGHGGATRRRGGGGGRRRRVAAKEARRIEGRTGSSNRSTRTFTWKRIRPRVRTRWRCFSTCPPVPRR